MSSFDFSIFSSRVQSSLQQRRLREGEVLFHKHDPVESVFFCESGCVRIESRPGNQKPIVLYRVKGGEAFGEEHLMVPQYRHSAVGDQKTVVVFAPKQLILEDVRTNPQIALRFVSCLATRSFQLSLNFERIGISSAKDRVWHLLITLQQELGDTIDLTRKIKSFADDVNLSHEATYRALKELERTGKIARQDGVIQILNLPESI